MLSQNIIAKTDYFFVFLIFGVSLGSDEKCWSNDYTLLLNREWSQKQKHKKTITLVGT